MKKFKKILALVLAFTMIMGLAMTASAKTIVSTNQDASVMTMSSTMERSATMQPQYRVMEVRKIRRSPDTPITSCYPKAVLLAMLM